MKESLQPEQSGDTENIGQMSLWVIAVMAIAIFAGVEKTKARAAAVILWLIGILPEVVFAT